MPALPLHIYWSVSFNDSGWRKRLGKADTDNHYAAKCKRRLWQISFCKALTGFYSDRSGTLRLKAAPSDWSFRIVALLMQQRGALIKFHQSFGQHSPALSFQIKSSQHTKNKVMRKKREQLQCQSFCMEWKHREFLGWWHSEEYTKTQE